MCLSDDCVPFPEHGKKGQTATTEIFSPKVSQFHNMLQSSCYTSREETFPHSTTSLSKGSCGRRTHAAHQRKGEQEWQRQRASQELSTISMAMVPRLSPGRRYANAWNRGSLRVPDQADLTDIPAGWQRCILMVDRTSCRWESTTWMALCTSVREQTPAKR